MTSAFALYIKSDLGVYLKHNYIQRAFLFFMYWSQNLCQMFDNGCDYSQPELASQPPNPTRRSFGFRYSDSVGMCVCSVRITCGEKPSNIRFVSGNLSWHICSNLFFFSCMLLEALYSNLSARLLYEARCQGFPCQKLIESLSQWYWVMFWNPPGGYASHGLWKVLHLCGSYLVTWAFWHSALWPIHVPPVILSGSNLFFQPHSGAFQSLGPVMQSTGVNGSISLFNGAPVRAG